MSEVPIDQRFLRPADEGWRIGDKVRCWKPGFFEELQENEVYTIAWVDFPFCVSFEETPGTWDMMRFKKWPDPNFKGEFHVNEPQRNRRRGPIIDPVFPQPRPVTERRPEPNPEPEPAAEPCPDESPAVVEPGPDSDGRVEHAPARRRPKGHPPWRVRQSLPSFRRRQRKGR